MAKCFYFRQTLVTGGDGDMNVSMEDTRGQGRGGRGGGGRQSVVNSRQPCLSDAILETDSFLRHCGISDDASNSSFLGLGLSSTTSSSSAPMPVPDNANASLKCETGEIATPTNQSPILTPKVGSPTGESGYGDHNVVKGSSNEGIQFQPSFYDLLTNAAQQQQQSIQQNEQRAQELLLQHLLPQLANHMQATNDDDRYQSEASSTTSSVSESSSNWKRDLSLDDSSTNRHVGTFRALSTGLDPIPENDVTEMATVWQPLVPPAVPKPVTQTYNISFPTTLQPRERFDFWRQQETGGGNAQTSTTTSAPGWLASQASTSPGNWSSASSSNQPSPFHGALDPLAAAAAASSANVWDEFQPMNIIIDSSAPPPYAMSAPILSSSPQQQTSSNLPPPIVGPNHFPAAGAQRNKRHRRSGHHTDEDVETEDVGDGASSRLRRRSLAEREAAAAAAAAAAAMAMAAAATGNGAPQSRNVALPTVPLPPATSSTAATATPAPPPPSIASSSTAQSGLPSDHRRRDNIKSGLEELQKIAPHARMVEGEKMSQAAILWDAGKHIGRLNQGNAIISAETEAVKEKIELLKSQIEEFQGKLPENGTTFQIPKTLATKSLPDQFHDHVVSRVKDDWRFWVFVHIMGHFVHSFDQVVTASDYSDLETTSLEWITNNLSLKALRKDAYRKLAKLSAKTSIIDHPDRLAEEAVGYVTRGEMHYSKKTD